MAQNENKYPGNKLQVTLAGVASGAPVVVGTVPGLTGVAMGASFTDANGVANQVLIERRGTHNLSVKGVTNSATNSAITQGEPIYINLAHTPVLDKDTTGVLFGYAMQPVISGATTTIEVALK